MNPKTIIAYMRFRMSGLSPVQAIKAVRTGESVPHVPIYINVSGFRQMDRRAANRMNPQPILLRQERSFYTPSGKVYRAYNVNQDRSLVELFLAEESAESLKARIQRNDPHWCYTFTVEPMNPSTIEYRDVNSFSARDELKTACDTMYHAMSRAGIMWANLAHKWGYNHPFVLRVEAVYRKRVIYTEVYNTHLQIHFKA